MRRRRLTRREKRSKRKKAVIVSTLCLLFVMTAGYAAFQTNLSITAKGNIKEPSRVIQSWNQYSNEDFHTDYYRENIVSVFFLDTNQVASNATESWDVSEDGKGGVKAWVVPNTEDTTKYDLYIGANDGVIANENSDAFFEGFRAVKTIEFNNNFYTDNVTNMHTMFYHCESLVELDLSSFKTQKVTNMGNLFDGCNSLITVNLSSFDTGNVIDMHQMFYGCESLVELDLSSFNTQNVETTWYMFYRCAELKILNLCNFDTNNVKIVASMFRGTTNLQAVYVGPNWTTEQADTTDMFLYSNISSVTTGQC